MRNVVAGFLAVIFGFTMVLHSEEASAKRFGSGSSFGSKNSFNAPQKRSAVDAPSKQQAAPNTAGAAAGGAAAGAGAKTGMMGMLGGLAMGGLLGAMFFGGAFENINFMDILIFGLIAFLAFKLLSGRRRAASPQPAGAYGSAPQEFRTEPQQPASVQTRNSSQGFDTDILFNKKRPASSGSVFSMASGAAVSIPKDFDQHHFIEGAKSLFARMQHAWDVGDLGDIRQFSTDKVFAEVQDQFHAREGENKTEILDLNAELLSVNAGENELEATVLFKAELREYDLNSGVQPQASTVEEVWHFVKPKSSIQPTWYLDGIQQIED